MPNVDLQPLAKSEDAFRSYMDINFRRIAEALNALTNLEGGEVDVTGSVLIDTGIPQVHYVMATMVSDITAQACLVSAKLDTSGPRNILIRVYDSAFVTSSVAARVAWLAVGVA